ncbi:MAG TPA: ssDNA-binding protein [Gemmatimonadaceae bacterium]|nr:ssDNA-binding protein [Gemmatimonadaceae bacterium]
MATNNIDEIKIIGEGQLSFPRLYEPQPSKTIGKDGKPVLKYTMTLVLTDPEKTKALKKAYLDAVFAKFGRDKGMQLIKDEELKSPFLTKKLEKYGYPPDSCYIRVSSVKRPGVVADFRDPSTGKPAKITDPERMYSGVQVKATLRLFWYDNDGNKGFSFGLNNVQRLTRRGEDGKPSKEDWPRCDGRVNAEDDFDADDDLDAADFDADSGSVTGDVSDLV